MLLWWWKLVQGLKTSFMRQILGVLFCAFINIDQCLPNAMQKCTQMKIYQESDSSFSLLLLLQQANKQREKAKQKNVGRRRSWKIKISCPTLHSCWFSGRKGRIWLAQKIKLFKGWPNLIHTKIGVCLFVCMIIVTKPWSALNHGAPYRTFWYFQKAL